MNEPWRESWRALAAHLPREGLESLLAAVLADDPRLCLDRTLRHGGEKYEAESAPEACCPAAFCWWREASTCAGIYQAFAQACFACERAAGWEPATTPPWAGFTRWLAATPRAAALALLAPEVRLAIEGRAAA